VKEQVLRFAAFLSILYFRHFPIAAGKAWVWYGLVWRYIVWRGFHWLGRTRFGAKMWTRFPDQVQTYIYFFGVWEPVITAYVKQTLSPGDTFIDVGANVGYYSLLASKLVGPSGHVYAIEASPSIFEDLQANLALNHARNVTAINLAAADREYAVPIYLADHHNLGSTSIVKSHVGEDAKQEAMIQAKPLAAILPAATIRQARIIKIDAEGAEWLIAQGIRDILPTLSPETEFIVEANADSLKEFGATVSDFFALFKEARFEPFAIENKYGVELYLKRPELRLLPCGTHFKIIDIVFRRA
jgi:FkbM family methyltransferase